MLCFCVCVIDVLGNSHGSSCFEFQTEEGIPDNVYFRWKILVEVLKEERLSNLKAGDYCHNFDKRTIFRIPNILSLFFVALGASQYCLYKSNIKSCEREFEYIISEVEVEQNNYSKLINQTNDQYASIYISEDLSRPLNLSYFQAPHLILQGRAEHPSVSLTNLPKSVKLVSLQICNEELVGQNIEVRDVLFSLNSKIKADRILANPNELPFTRVTANTFEVESPLEINAGLDAQINELQIREADSVRISEGLEVNGQRVPKAGSYSLFNVRRLRVEGEGMGRPVAIHPRPSFVLSAEGGLPVDAGVRVMSVECQEFEEISGAFETNETCISVGSLKDAALRLRNGGYVYVTGSIRGNISCNRAIIVENATVLGPVVFEGGHVIAASRIVFVAGSSIECERFTFGSPTTEFVTEAAQLCVNAGRYVYASETPVSYAGGRGSFLELLQLVDGPRVEGEEAVPAIRFGSNFPRSILSYSIDAGGHSRLEARAAANESGGAFVLVPGVDFNRGSPFDTRRTDWLAAIVLIFFSVLYLVLLCMTNCCDRFASSRDVKHHVKIPARRRVMREKLMEAILFDYCRTGPLDFDSASRRYESVRQWQEQHVQNLKDGGERRERMKEARIEGDLAKAVSRAIESKGEGGRADKVFIHDVPLKEITSAGVMERVYQDYATINEALSMESLLELCDYYDKQSNYFTDEKLVCASYETYKLVFKGYKQYPGSNVDNSNTLYIPLTGFVNKSDLHTNMILGIPDNISLDTVRAFTNLVVYRRKSTWQIRMMKLKDVREIRRDFPWEDMGDAEHVTICPYTSLPCILDQNKKLDGDLQIHGGGTEDAEAETRSINTSEYYVRFVKECRFFPTWQQLLSFIYLRVVKWDGTSLKFKRPTLPRKIVEHVAYIVQDYNRMLRVYYYGFGVFDREFLYKNISTHIEYKDARWGRYNEMMQMFNRNAEESRNGVVRYQREMRMQSDFSADGVLKQFFGAECNGGVLPKEEEIRSAVEQARSLSKSSIRNAFTGHAVSSDLFIPFQIVENLGEAKGIEEFHAEDNKKLLSRVFYLTCLNMYGGSWTPPPLIPDKALDDKEAEDKVSMEKSIAINSYFEYIEIHETVPDAKGELLNALLEFAWYNFYNFRNWPMGSCLKSMFEIIVYAHRDPNFQKKNTAKYYSSIAARINWQFQYFKEGSKEESKWFQAQRDNILSNKSIKRSCGEGVRELFNELISKKVKGTDNDKPEYEGLMLQNEYESFISTVPPEDIGKGVGKNIGKNIGKSIGKKILVLVAGVYFKTAKGQSVGNSTIPVYCLTSDVDKIFERSRDRLNILVQTAKRNGSYSRALDKFKELHPDDARAMVYAHITGTDRADLARVWLSRTNTDLHVLSLTMAPTPISSKTFCPSFDTKGMVNPYRPINVFDAYMEEAKRLVENKVQRFPSEGDVLHRVFMKYLPNKNFIQSRIERGMDPAELGDLLVLLPSNIEEIVSSVVLAYDNAIKLAGGDVTVGKFYKTAMDTINSPFKQLLNE